MRSLCRAIEKVAPTNATVLLLGDSGTGKELLARAAASAVGRARTSRSSPSTARPSPTRCSRASCSATRRAPSPGAAKRTPASSSLPTAARCSWTRSARCPPRCRRSCCAWCRSARWSASAAARRSRSICASCAPPTATSRPLIGTGGFRDDLFYRISEVTVRVPPLRDRQGDSLLLAQFLLQQMAERFGKPTRGLAPGCHPRHPGASLARQRARAGEPHQGRGHHGRGRGGDRQRPGTAGPGR